MCVRGSKVKGKGQGLLHIETKRGYFKLLISRYFYL